MKKAFLFILLFPLMLQANNFENTTTGFEENLGQLADFEGKKVNDVLFYSRSNDIGVFITKTGVSYVIYRNEQLPQAAGMNQDIPGKDIKPQKLHYARTDIELVNAGINRSNIEFFDEQPGYKNYYYAHCADEALNVKTFREVRIKEIYEGIDWIWKYDSYGVLHHEFELSTDADPKEIKIKVKWADFEISPDGKKLTLSTPLGKIVDGGVIAHNSSSIMFPVEVIYKEEDGLIYYDVINWNRTENLIIDPPLVLTWATYYGGSGTDISYSITTDAAGNVFVTGETESINFPTHNPGGGAYFQGASGSSRDIFILKFSNTGVRAWATYYGGSGQEYGISITTDAAGNVFVTGGTSSTNFPTHNPGGGAYFQGAHGVGFWDIFILKFSTTGVREWATFYGGSVVESGHSITTDIAGNVFVTGSTTSPDFPTQNPGGGAYFQDTYTGNRDVFILKFSNTGVRAWATYYGGSDSWDDGNSITTDAAGNVFVTGQTNSNNFPTHNPGGGAYFQGTSGGEWEVFILKFSNTGVREWATYYGGGSNDYGNSITTDAAGNVFVTGSTESTNFSTHNPGGGAYFQGAHGGGFTDGFILKFSNTGVRDWATFYGGSTSDRCNSITTDAAGNVFVTGLTNSTNFPTQNPGGGAYFQGASGGGYDVFILMFSNTSVRDWATYYGGSALDVGRSITTDAAGNVFVTGQTDSNNFPTHNPGGDSYFQGAHGGGFEDGFIAKFGDFSTGIESISNNQPNKFALHQNYPNPFNPTTNIRFDIQKQGFVTLKVYDVMGKEVATLVNETLSPGTYIYQFSTDNYQLTSGVYFYKLEAEGVSEVTRMILLK